MKQIARNLTDCEDGFLSGKRYLIMDRDKKFTEAFRTILEDEDVESVRVPPVQVRLWALVPRRAPGGYL